MHIAIFMLFVHHKSNNPVAEEFSSSGAHLTLTDGHVMSSLAMDVNAYSEERYWLAGCIKIEGTSYKFAQVNVFLNSRPDLEVPNLCLQTFGYQVKTEETLPWLKPSRYFGST